MSTQFTATSTGEWAFTRWCAGERGTCVDFGAGDRVFAVVEAAQAGETFQGEDASVFTAADVNEFVASGRTSFGEFGGTFEVGSGDAAAFTGF